MLTSPHLVTRRAKLTGHAFELAAIRLQLLLRKANFNPGQLRDPLGRWTTEGGDGLVHDVARRRGGRREGTPAQEGVLLLRLSALELHSAGCASWTLTGTALEVSRHQKASKAASPIRKQRTRRRGTPRQYPARCHTQHQPVMGREPATEGSSKVLQD